MNTTQFLDCLHDHPATHALAETLTSILAIRVAPDLVPATVPTRERAAS